MPLAQCKLFYVKEKAFYNALLLENIHIYTSLGFALS